MLLSSCDKKNKIEKEVEEIPVTIKVERFDKIFYETPVENFQNIKQKYPYFFPAATPDSIWVNKINNPLYRELYTEVQKKYSNFEKVNSNLESLFKHIKYYFPNVHVDVNLLQMPSTHLSIFYELYKHFRVQYSD